MPGNSCALQLPASGVWAQRRPRLRHASGSCTLHAATFLRLPEIWAILGCFAASSKPTSCFCRGSIERRQRAVAYSSRPYCAVGGGHNSSSDSSLLDKQHFHAQLQGRAGVCCA